MKPFTFLWLLVGCIGVTFGTPLAASTLSAGQVLRDQIPISRTKSILLPPGSWQIEAFFETTTPLTGGSRTSQPIKNIVLTNTDNGSPVSTYVASWSEFADVNWGGNNSCNLEGNLKQPYAESFGTTLNSPTVRCVTAGKFVNFRSTVSGSSFSSNTFVKSNFIHLASKSNQLPLHALVLSGSLRRIRGDTVAWWIYINPVAAGLSQGTVDRVILNAPLGLAESQSITANPLNFVLSKYYEWNKDYLLGIEAGFYPSFFGGGVQAARRTGLPPVVTIPSDLTITTSSENPRPLSGVSPQMAASPPDLGRSERDRLAAQPVFSSSSTQSRLPPWVIFSTHLNSGALRGLPWREKLDRIVQAELRDWLTPDTKGLEEIPLPAYPAALSLKQESWETNKEFEERVASARAERGRTIDRLQAEYRTRVEERNRRVSEHNKLRQDREAKLVERRRELILMGLTLLTPAIVLSDISFNQQTGDLTITNQMDGLEKQVFSFAGTSQAFRRAALTEPKALKASAEFEVTDAGQIVVRALNVEAGGVSAKGLPSSSSAAPMQLASVTITSTPAPVIAQQSAVTVDRNQVEQILYREENENLRKRLEDQRRQQEQAVASAEARAAAEIARIRAEADAERKRLSEVRPTQNLVSVQEAHALVIGNSAYPGSNRLANPVNDATAMSAKLRSMGFRVSEISNANREQMVRSLSEFSRTASKADLTLLFYAGHGVQIQGVNYMVPVDMSLSDPAQATLQAVSLTQVVEQYLPGKTKLVFLDACRDNPLMNSGLRGVARGLAPINVSEGTLISYATKDGQTASDGVGARNSPFTTALLEHLGDPSDIAVVLRKVREKVMQATGGKQQPWEYGSLTGGELVLSRITAR